MTRPSSRAARRGRGRSRGCRASPRIPTGPPARAASPPGGRDPACDQPEPHAERHLVLETLEAHAEPPRPPEKLDRIDEVLMVLEVLARVGREVDLVTLEKGRHQEEPRDRATDDGRERGAA